MFHILILSDYTVLTVSKQTKKTFWHVLIIVCMSHVIFATMIWSLHWIEKSVSVSTCVLACMHVHVCAIVHAFHCCWSCYSYHNIGLSMCLKFPCVYLSMCLDFVQRISPETLNLLWPDLVLWCTITSQSVVQKNLFAIFKVEVTVRAFIIKIWLYYSIF